MGSRVLLSQDLSASKFSMIILETMHRGPEEAGHTPAALAQVAVAAAAAAAAAPSSARRRPRGPRWEVPVAGSREPRSASSSAGPPPPATRPPARRPPPPGSWALGGPRPRAEAATVDAGPPPCPALPPNPSEASRKDRRTRPGPQAFLAPGPGTRGVPANAAARRRRARPAEGGSMGNGSGGLPGFQHPQEDGCRQTSRERTEVSRASPGACREETQARRTVRPAGRMPRWVLCRRGPAPSFLFYPLGPRNG